MTEHRINSTINLKTPLKEQHQEYGYKTNVTPTHEKELERHRLELERRLAKRSQSWQSRFQSRPVRRHDEHNHEIPEQQQQDLNRRDSCSLQRQRVERRSP
ncbi:hypothetical protein S83_067024 [Arachis hypogaea]